MAARGGLAALLCCVAVCGAALLVEGRKTALGDGMSQADLNAIEILERFDDIIPCEARKLLEERVGTVRRRLLKAKPHPKPHHRPHAKPHTKPHARPHAKPHAKPHTKPHAKPHAKPTPRPVMSTATTAASCQETFGTTGKVVAVLVADIGTFSSVSEGTFYAANLKNNVTVKSTLCVGRQHGKIAGVDVVLAATGIGPGAAAICGFELLLCAANIREILFSGTSGFTPQVGGIIDTSDCTQAQPARQIARLGDVCVSPYALNWNCKLADYSEQVVGAPNLCSVPDEDYGPSADFLFGDCVFTTPDPLSTALTTNVLKAINKTTLAALSTRTPNVYNYESAYWNLTNLGAAPVNYTYSPGTPPTIFGPETCMEVDSQFFYTGAPFDQIGRQYMADALSGNTTAGYGPGAGFNVTRAQMLVSSAEEAVGLTELLYKFNALPANPKVGFVFVRGASDYQYAPMQHNGTFWSYFPNNPTADFTSGYAYAIATSSYVVMNYIASLSGGSFTVSYPGTVSGA